MKGFYKSYKHAVKANGDLRIVPAILDGEVRFSAAIYLRVAKLLSSYTMGKTLYQVAELRNGAFGLFAYDPDNITLDTERPFAVYSKEEDALTAHYVIARRHQESNHFA